MKILFMGTPDFALKILDTLINSEEHEIIGVYTQPDRPAGRGSKLTMSPVKIRSLEKNIPCHQPEKIKNIDDVNILKSVVEKHKPDVFIVAAYGQILSQEILDMPRYGCINVHASILPKYRGAAPIHWAIINGEQKSGVTIMQMEKGLDTGDILNIVETPIFPQTTFANLHDELATIGGVALMDTLRNIEKYQENKIKQDNELSSYAPMIDKNTSKIEWEKHTSTDIRNIIQALGAWTTFEGTTIKFFDIDIIDNRTYESSGKVLQSSPKDGIMVSTLSGAIKINELQKQGGKRLKAPDFLNGFGLEVGKSFI